MTDSKTAGWDTWEGKRVKDTDPKESEAFKTWPNMPVSTCILCGSAIEYFEATWWVRGTCKTTCGELNHTPIEHKKAKHNTKTCEVCCVLNEQEVQKPDPWSTPHHTSELHHTPKKWGNDAEYQNVNAVTMTPSKFGQGGSGNSFTITSTAMLFEEKPKIVHGFVRVTETDSGQLSVVMLPEEPNWEPYVTITDSVIMIRDREGVMHGWSLDCIKWKIVPWKPDEVDDV